MRHLLIEGKQHKTEVTHRIGLPFMVTVYRYNPNTKDYDVVDCEHYHDKAVAYIAARDLHNFFLANLPYLYD